MEKTTFRQLDVKKYQVVFVDTDVHTPDLIVWELKQRPEFKQLVSFAETRRVEGINGNTVEMEVHLKITLADVPELIRSAAEQSAKKWQELSNVFENALKGL